jgi:GLPGLI family protein
MRKISILIIVLVLTGISNPILAGSKKFTGKITYSISYEGKQIDEATQDMMPKTMMTYIGDGFTKNVLFTGMGKQTVIYDIGTKSRTVLMDMMGQQFAIESLSTDIEKEFGQMPDGEVEFVDETKVIAGYQCKKIVISFKNDEGEIKSENIAWYIEDLEVSPDINFDMKFFKGVQGVLMEYQMDMNNGTYMKFTAIEVEKEKLSSKDFIIPENYKKVTQEELMNSLGR